MLATRLPRHTIFAFITATLISTTSAIGQVATYVQPFDTEPAAGSTFEDDVNALPRLIAIETEDFDNADSTYPPGTRVPTIGYLDDSLILQINTNAPDSAAYIFQSTFYFAYPNAVDFQALVMGSNTATLTFASDDVLVGGLGFWVFDDGNARDSAYLIQATDQLGHSTEVILESATPRINGYQMEGFAGVTSRVGLTVVKITPIDPITGEPWLDIFEIDSLTVALIQKPEIADDADELPLPSDDDDNADDDAGQDAPSVESRRRCERRIKPSENGRRCRNNIRSRNDDNRAARRRSRYAERRNDDRPSRRRANQRETRRAGGNR